MDSIKIIKGSLTAIILKLLENNGKMYGYEITKAVRDATKGKASITEASLYPTLHKLESEGYLKTEKEIVDGRLRKYYKLQEIGRKEAEVRLSELETSFEALKNIFKYKLKTT